MHIFVDSPNATPSQSRTTFNSSPPPLGPIVGGGDTPSALSGYGDISPHSITTNTDDSLSPLTGGESSSGIPTFPDVGSPAAVMTHIDGHQVNVIKINPSLFNLIILCKYLITEI